MVDLVMRTSYNINRFINKILGGNQEMTNQQRPEFKPGFRYQNIGNIVGTLNYARELRRKDGSAYGWEFLINARGFGSVNVRIPIMHRAQNSFDNFPVSERPRVRAGLTRIEQFTSEKGKTYTSATTFVELSEALTVSGEEMKDNIAGRIAGEIYNIQQIQGENGPALRFNIITYPVDKNNENERAKYSDGTPVDPQVLTLEAHDPQIIAQLQQTVRQGSNIEVGYKYFNKSNVKYDEYGFAINDKDSVIERLEVGKVVVHGAPRDQGNGFGNQQGGFGIQQNGFGNMQQPAQQPVFNQQPQQGQVGFGDPNQYQLPNNQYPFSNDFNPNQQQGTGNENPFAGAQELQQGSPDFEEAQRVFGNNNQNHGFGFGQ